MRTEEGRGWITGKRALLLALPALALVAVLSHPAAPAGAAKVPPPVITNKFFPLKAGTVFTYHSNQVVKAGPKRTTVKVTSDSSVIQGERCIMVDTKEFKGGKNTEHFRDWYFQGSGGTVWYMKHKSLRKGTRGESWEAGKNGVSRGIAMPAYLKVGKRWKISRAPGKATDSAKVTSVSTKILNIDVTSPQYSETLGFRYKAGVGLVRLQDKGEITRLTKVKRP
jgi:hypothetical protein